MIYVELEKKSLKNMWKVMLLGTIGATIAYLIAGIFGYATFASYPFSGYDTLPYNATCADIMNL